MTEHLTKTNILCELCRATQKWGMIIHISDEDNTEDIYKAAPYLSLAPDTTAQMICDGWGIFLFDSVTEMNNYFDQTAGDEPGKLNTYKGTCSIFALTCDPTGELLSENT